MYKDSIYNKMFEDAEERKSTGFNYRKDGVLDKFFSNRMFGNPVMDGFLERAELYFIEIIDSVKKIQFYNNYTIDKNDGRINL